LEKRENPEKDCITTSYAKSRKEKLKKNANKKEDKARKSA